MSKRSGMHAVQCSHDASYTLCIEPEDPPFRASSLLSRSTPVVPLQCTHGCRNAISLVVLVMEGTRNVEYLGGIILSVRTKRGDLDGLESTAFLLVHMTHTAQHFGWMQRPDQHTNAVRRFRESIFDIPLAVYPEGNLL